MQGNALKGPQIKGLAWVPAIADTPFRDFNYLALFGISWLSFIARIIAGFMRATFGTFSLYRLPKPSKRWKLEGVREYNVNWTVYFFVGEKEPLVRSASLYPICVKCLEVEHGKDPVEERKSCECHRGAARWAESFLKTQVELMRAGQMKKLEELRTPTKWTPVSEVLAVYRERGPGDRVQRLNYLDSIYEQTTGRETARMQWDDLTGDLLRDWAELRQEAGRKGWLGAGAGKNMPAKGWETLRAAKAANKLPRLDTSTVAEWNTTIVNYLASVKSIFGESARGNELRGLNIPPLESFLAVKLKKVLPVPEGHKEIPENVMAAIEKALPKLLVEDPLAWTFFMICDESGLRPVSVCRLSNADLRTLSTQEAAEVKRQMAKEWKVREEELSDFGALLTVGAAKNGNPITTPLSAEVAAMALQQGAAEAVINEARAEVEKVRRRIAEHRARHGETDSPVNFKRALARSEMRLKRALALLGVDVNRAYKRLNAWLRKRGLDGQQAAYLLRHRKGQAMRQFGGKSAVSAALGHKGEAMADRYSEERRVVPAVFSSRGKKVVG